MLNTTYRRPRGRGAFSYAAVINSCAFQVIEKPPGVSSSVMAGEGQKETGTAGQGQDRGRGERGRRPLRVDFGSWVIEEVQICEMGSWGPSGEYVSVHSINIGS